MKCSKNITNYITCIYICVSGTLYTMIYKTIMSSPNKQFVRHDRTTKQQNNK